MVYRQWWCWILSANNGTTWSVAPTGSNSTAWGAYGNGAWVCAGDTTTTRTTNTNPNGGWVTGSVGFSGAQTRGIDYVNDLFIIVGSNGRLSTSTTGDFIYINKLQEVTTALNSSAYGNGIYVVAGSNLV